MNPSLNVLISTIDEGIFQINNVVLPKRNDVSYIISHQYTEEKFRLIPEELIREDIKISQINGKGISKSRNNALKLADAQIGLFADDDVKYTNEYFNTIIEQFNKNHLLDVACFKIQTPKGSPEYKHYQDNPFKVDMSTAHNISSIEIAIDIKKIQSLNIKFDERFGVGQSLIIAGEEYVFISDCIKKGLNIWYFPEFIVEHPYESTIKSISKFDKKRVYVVGANDARINGVISIPKAFYYTLRLLPSLRRNKKNPFQYLKERLSAVFYILKTHND